ncbi:MAG: Sec-independent protein translocase protein TatB [Hansschlegelia sp.]
MFDIAWSEFLVVAVVALVVVGPKDLPPLLRTVGKMVAQLRKMAGEFQTQFNEAMREAELDELRKEVTGLKDQAKLMTGGNPLQIARDEIKSAIEGKSSSQAKPTPSALAGATPEPDAAASDAPSALAPEPEPAPLIEPPAPTVDDFIPLNPAKANGAHRVAAAEPDDAPRAPAPGAGA